MADCATECNCYWRNVHDRMVHGETALENESDEDIPITAKDRSRDPPVWKENGGSGDLKVADHEDVQETEASDIHVNRLKSQEVPVEEHYALPCANGNSRLLYRPSIAE